MNEQQEARELLEKLAEHLRKQKLPTTVQGKAVSLPWAVKSAECIESYLNGDKNSLDEAFGLKRRKGRPSKPEYREKIARQAIAWKSKDMLWEEVVSKFESEKNIYLDESVIRAYATEFAHKIMIDDASDDIGKEIIRYLASDLPSGKK